MTPLESIERFATKLAVHQASFNELLGLPAFEEQRQEWRYYYFSLGYSLPEVLTLEYQIAECHDRIVRINGTLERHKRERNAQKLIAQGNGELVAIAAKYVDGNLAMIYCTPALSDELYQIMEDSQGKVVSCKAISDQTFKRRLRNGNLNRPSKF